MEEEKPPGGGQSSKETALAGALDARLDRVVPSEPASAFLLVTKGEQPGRVYPLLHNTVLIGRGDTCDIQLLDPSVSFEHVRVLNGALGYEVEDLNSTNGTMIDDQRIGRARLGAGQRLRLGAVEFTFMRDRKNEPTVAIVPTVLNPGGPMSDGRPMRLPAAARVSNDEDGDGPSFQEMVGTVVRFAHMLKRHTRAAAAIIVALATMAVASLFLLPPASFATCEVKLHPESKNNPVESGQVQPGVSLFFNNPERAFTSADLVQHTFVTLNKRDPSSDEVEQISSRLKLEGLGDNHYLASYAGPSFSKAQQDVLAFLSTHMNGYFQSEIDKALMVFVKEVEFLRSQTTSADKDLEAIGQEKRKFKESNVDLVPETAAQTLSTRADMGQRRVELVAQVERLSGEVASAHARLANGGPLAAARAQASSAHKTKLAEIDQKLAELRAQGLTDNHPDVRALLDQRRTVEALVETSLGSKSTANDQRTSSAFEDLQANLQLLQSQLSAARTELGEIERNLSYSKHVLDNQPRVDARLQELEHSQEAAAKLHAQLFDQLKKAEVRLELERVSVSSRYEIVTAPRLIKVRRLKVGAMRLGISLGVSILFIALFIAFRELRPIVAEAWATADGYPRPVTRR